MNIMGLAKKIIALLKKLRPKKSQSETEEKKAPSNAFDHDAWRENMRALKPLKQFLRRHRVPCFLVLGLAQSGKSALIAQSSYHFVLDLHEQNQPQFVRVWCSDQAIFFELQADTLQSAKARRLTLRHLKRYGRIKNVLMCLACDQLNSTASQALSSSARLLRKTLLEVQRVFHWRYPVHVFLTKMDQIKGFEQYVSTVPQGENTPLSFENAEAYPHFEYQDAWLERAFGEVINEFQQQLPQRMSYLTQAAPRQAVYGLMGELTALMPMLKASVSVIMGHTHFDGEVPLQRIVLVSAQLTSGQLSFQAANYTHAFGLQASQTEQALIDLTSDTTDIRNNKTYQTQLVGTGDALKMPTRLRHLGGLSTRVLAVVAALLLVGGLVVSSGKLIMQFNQQGQMINTQLTDLSTQSADQQLLVLSNLLNNISQDRHLLADHLVFKNHQKLLSALLPQFQHLAAVHFMPQMMQQLEQALKHDKGLKLYQTLRVYLMLVEPQHLNAQSVLHWFINHRSVTQASAFDKQTQLNLLRWYLQETPKALPVNQALVDAARARLYHLPVADLFYMALKDKAMNKPHAYINLSRVIGVSYLDMFVRHASQGRVLKLFTQQGLEHIYPQLQKQMLSRDQEQNWVLGQHVIQVNKTDIESVRQQMNSDYVHDYIQYWSRLLNNLPLRNWTTVAQAQQMLTQLASEHSLLKKVLSIARDNTNVKSGIFSSLFSTQAMVNAASQVNDAFVNLTGKTASTAYAQLHKNIVALSVAMQAVPAGNAQGMVKTTQSILQGKFKAIAQLMQSANHMPAPFNAWARAIAQQSVRAIFTETAQTVNAQWHLSVVDPNKAVFSHYPINAQSTTNMNILTFKRLFGRAGVATQFVTKNVLPLINTSATTPTANRYLGVTIPLSKNLVAKGLAINLISQNWFNDKDQLDLHYQITPVSLDSEAASFTLNVGDQQINYRHGPALPSTVMWSQESAIKMVSLVFKSLSGQIYTQQFSGPWALLRAMNTANINPAQGNEAVYHMTFSHDGYNMTYQIALPQPGLFALKLLQQ